ncbi:hypothetical protein G7Y31_00760 [Corynebacterium lizhenjunii]|uniref:Uncharacterized protein n=1 Tax=Corynebacterium lizhenjunii TaxID=2709394 RepID=A0A7T0KG23_9CORY|nr:hypothetical protein [Corynebacterium lizhenjunii]QPK79294.1 hypothetical protein G7Y31_00760 [Corynebacterium lizhenjunii]
MITLIIDAITGIFKTLPEIIGAFGGAGSSTANSVGSSASSVADSAANATK